MSFNLPENMITSNHWDDEGTACPICQGSMTETTSCGDTLRCDDESCDHILELTVD